MRITQIVPSLEARHGGPSRSVRGLSEGLAGIGESVSLLTTGPVEKFPRVPGLEIRTFSRQWPEMTARSYELEAYLRTDSQDIVHHHGLWQCTLGYARAAAARTGAPLVISPRGMMSEWAWNHRRWKKRLASVFIHPRAFATAAGWHATSAEEADDIRRRGFSQPVCVAPNGVIAPSPDEETAAASHWRELLPALADRRVALFYSRFHAKKRVLELIDLWLSKPRGDWILLIAGIPEQYGVNQLDAYLVRNGGVGRVVIQDGVGRPPPYAVSSLFLLPTHSENFGLVVAEALVRGVPVLTTDGTPWQELAARGAGDCVRWEDYGAAMDRFLAEPADALHAAGVRARTWASASFSWETTARRLREFYSGLSASR